MYRLILDDGGRNLSKRPGQFNDCTVRAISILTRTKYDIVYDTLGKAGRKPCDGFDSSGWIRKKRGKVFGYKLSPLNVDGLTPSTFFDRYYVRGRYLLETDEHTWSVINGVARDMHRVKEVPLTGAWIARKI